MVAVFYRHARDLGACDPVPVLKRNEFFFMLVTMLASTLDLRAYKLIPSLYERKSIPNYVDREDPKIHFFYTFFHFVETR
jgi:hypothetical protein